MNDPHTPEHTFNSAHADDVAGYLNFTKIVFVTRPFTAESGDATTRGRMTCPLHPDLSQLLP